VSATWRHKWVARWAQWFGARRPASDEVSRAQALIAAIDAGGVPLYPGKVNHIARALGLEVSSKAPVEDTIERIRQALARA
jgi:hypothetical protein